MLRVTLPTQQGEFVTYANTLEEAMATLKNAWVDLRTNPDICGKLGGTSLNPRLVVPTREEAEDTWDHFVCRYVYTDHIQPGMLLLDGKVVG